jgi:LCP family protein required for cell wall assembly
VGGNATNTLILIHIPAGGRRAVGFSIPRDDLVNYAGTVGPQQQGKIDDAYGISMYYEEGLLRQKYPNMSQSRLAFLGNEAGRKAAVATVEKLTGVHIDHFAEVNLAGFWELAKVLGGVEVCLKHAVHDSYSGANFHAGYQHLDAQQALAFVRQRHGLLNGDLDRTHRQQAFIDAVIYKLRRQGVLTTWSKLSGLLGVAKRYVITDAGWNLLDFATQMHYLTSGHLVFRTLPIQSYGTWGNPVQDVNIVDVPSIQAIVHAAFYPPPGARTAPRHHHHTAPAGPPATVDVYNGTSVYHLAADVRAALVRGGYLAGQTGNTVSRSTTAVWFGTGAAPSARKIARLFGATAMPKASVPAGHVRILLGTGATVPNLHPSPSPSPSPTVIPSTGPQGGAVTAIGRRGIPCVNLPGDRRCRRARVDAARTDWHVTVVFLDRVGDPANRPGDGEHGLAGSGDHVGRRREGCERELDVRRGQRPPGSLGHHSIGHGQALRPGRRPAHQVQEQNASRVAALVHEVPEAGHPLAPPEQVADDLRRVCGRDRRSQHDLGAEARAAVQ